MLNTCVSRVVPMPDFLYSPTLFSKKLVLPVREIISINDIAIWVLIFVMVTHKRCIAAHITSIVAVFSGIEPKSLLGTACPLTECSNQ